MMASIMHGYVMKMDVVNACTMNRYGISVFERRCDRVDVLTAPHSGLRRRMISIKTQQRP
jgi:hypothetical protein